MSSYFNHPYALRNNPEILELRASLGFGAYAIYLMVLETIAESESQSINNKLIGGLSISFGCDVEFLKKVLEKAIELKLFFIKSDFIFSYHLKSHFEKRAEIKEKRALAGAIGGKSKANAKQMLANAKQNLPKERKERKKENINKIKENKEIIEEFFENSDFKGLISNKIIAYENQVWFSEQADITIKSIKENMIEYYTENPKGKKQEIKNITSRFYKFLESYKRADFYKYKEKPSSLGETTTEEQMKDKFANATVWL